MDDEQSMLDLIAQMLAHLGYGSVTACRGARGALEAIDRAAGHPHLIVLDLNMPDMDGVEFVRHLVKRGYRGGLILASGEDERMLRAAEKLVQAHRLKMLGCLQKPFKSATLAAMLEKLSPAAVLEPRAPAAPRTPSAAGRVYPAEEVRGAIAGGQLVNYYQPQVSPATGDVLGVEALARWRHPSDGLVSPDRFIGVAEAHGLIRSLTRRVLADALAHAARFREETGAAMSVAVNVSMDDLGDLDFVDYAAAQAAASGVPASRVTLEVTETRLMRNLRVSFEVLTRLRLKRFRLSIDDFGTGHSSLAQLRDIPFDELKIDRGFVHGASSDKTVLALFDASRLLAKRLGMTVVAEGVEDRADWDFLRRSACDAAQGYFIARPMPAESLLDWVRDWKARAAFPAKPA